MKSVKLIFLILIVILSDITHYVNSANLKLNTFLKSKISLKLNSDSILARIRTLIKEISNEHLKSNNFAIKKKIVGSLPEGYPQEMIDNAKKMRNNKELWSPLMLFPTKLWRFCLFPMFKINYKNWCISQFPTGSKEELNCNI